jgi:hypothetical protein
MMPDDVCRQSISDSWLGNFAHNGILVLAALVGATDIDPAHQKNLKDFFR